MSEPEIKFRLNDEGRIEYRVTNNGVLLSEEEAEQARRIATAMYERIVDLEQLVVDFYAYTFGGGDACKRCSYGSDCGAGNPCKFDEHVERRMKALGIEVDE